MAAVISASSVSHIGFNNFIIIEKRCQAALLHIPFTLKCWFRLYNFSFVEMPEFKPPAR